MHAVVAAGFGGLLAHGGDVLDKQALEAAGAEEPDARAQAAGLSGLELAVLAIGGCGAATAVLVSRLGAPPPDFTLPWALIPIPAMLIGFWAAERYRDRFRGRPGWRGAVGSSSRPAAGPYPGQAARRLPWQASAGELICISRTS